MSLVLISGSKSFVDVVIWPLSTHIRDRALEVAHWNVTAIP